MTEFKTLELVLTESVIYGARCRRNGPHGRKVAVVIKSLVNARSLQLQFARVLHEALSRQFCCIVVTQRCGGERKVRIRAVQKDNLRGL